VVRRGIAAGGIGAAELGEGCGGDLAELGVRAGQVGRGVLAVVVVAAIDERGEGVGAEGHDLVVLGVAVAARVGGGEDLAGGVEGRWFAEGREEALGGQAVGPRARGLGPAELAEDGAGRFAGLDGGEVGERVEGERRERRDEAREQQRDAVGDAGLADRGDDRERDVPVAGADADALVPLVEEVAEGGEQGGLRGRVAAAREGGGDRGELGGRGDRFDGGGVAPGRDRVDEREAQAVVAGARGQLLQRGHGARVAERDELAGGVVGLVGEQVRGDERRDERALLGGECVAARVFVVPQAREGEGDIAVGAGAGREQAGDVPRVADVVPGVGEERGQAGVVGGGLFGAALRGAGLGGELALDLEEAHGSRLLGGELQRTAA
jgi:hypothetical protein